MLVLHPKLHRIEELLHRVVENTEIGAPADHVLIDNLSLLVEPAAGLEEETQEVLILVVDLMALPAAYC